MARRERQNGTAVEQVADWITLARELRSERAEIERQADDASVALRRSLVDVRRGGTRAWRVLVLRGSDSRHLSALARKTRLSPIPGQVDMMLTYLVTECDRAVGGVRAASGIRRFFSGSKKRRAALESETLVIDFAARAEAQRLPEQLRTLVENARGANVVAVTDVLGSQVGLRHIVGDLGQPPELVEASRLAELRSSVHAIGNAAAIGQRLRAAAVEAGNETRRADTRRMLAEMPVDRLRQATSDKLRIGPLTENGVMTAMQVIDHGPWLEQLPGLGVTTATRIRGAAQTLWQTTFDEMPTRIDVTNRTSETTELLRRLRAWDIHRKAIGDRNNVPVGDLYALANTIDRQVNHLVVFPTADYPTTGLLAAADSVVRSARGLLGIAEEAGSDPWEDFIARPADYFALLDELGFITDDEKVHGDLPEEIVEAVRATELVTKYLSASLRGYQAFGARFALAQRKVIIGDEMGLGKTVEALAVLAHLRAKGQNNALVICPAAVVPNWVREVNAKSHLSSHRIHGPERAAAARNWLRKGGVAVTTFETLKWLEGTVVDLPDLGCVVVDEAHLVKNPAAQRSRRTIAILESCQRAILLTGTPLENKLDEFRSLVGYLRPDLVVNVSELAPRLFRRQVAPAYLRRNQEDVLIELPELVEVEELLPLSDQDAAAYRKAVRQGNFSAMRHAAMGSPTTSRKMQRLLEIVVEAEDNGRRVIVFSHFRNVLDAVTQALPPRNVFGPLTGSVPAGKRQEMVDSFSAASKGAVLVAQIVAGGVGLNIQAASVVVICEPQLKPTTEWQAIARARRMGQLESVQVHRLLSEEGVDQRITEILARKRALFEEFARVSETAASAPEAVDVTEAELARQVVAAERERLFSTVTAD
ncbi:DEAD/DEAH box helicase [Nocardia sp. NPDC050793]|uniref:DEAD/DEAH box helicase n=1 Tax=Nocardia sp. NPDC050793 TaxID=3155159 RepID=UPI0033E5CD8B